MRGLLVAAIAALAVAPVLMPTIAKAATAADQVAEPDKVAIYRESPDTYVGLGLISTQIEGGVLDQAPGGLHIRAGGMLDPNWGVEVRLARGFWHERQKVGDARVQIDIDHLAGFYLTRRWDFAVPVIEIPMVKGMFVQAQAGVAAAQIKVEVDSCATCRGGVDRNDRTDLSWGLGIGLNVRVPTLPNRVNLSLEYMDYGDKDDIEISAIEAGFQVFF
ncbi:MAG: outer membrane beta-barrel protein [Gammaproteobacteria bacterium]|nr:outer membrane beta-barrel protein [Gammaproteobacteria bacterium]MBQ0775610.1 outer membrane beta-barrel protein [Gammaproteobacteria bacterium]